MQMIREVRETLSEELVIHIPEAFRKRKVEVIILPLDGEAEKGTSTKIEDFLSLGGSGCWEGNLDEMRES